MSDYYIRMWKWCWSACIGRDIWTIQKCTWSSQLIRRSTLRFINRKSEFHCCKWVLLSSIHSNCHCGMTNWWSGFYAICIMVNSSWVMDIKEKGSSSSLMVSSVWPHMESTESNVVRYLFFMGFSGLSRLCLNKRFPTFLCQVA